MDLYDVDGYKGGTGELNEISKNRVQAVSEQILSYEPDLVGLQEDVNNWVNNMSLGDGYVRYKPDIEHTVNTAEYCSIYVKNGITVKDSGYKWLTSSGAYGTFALSYDELTDEDGKYYMTDDELSALGITDSQTLYTSSKTALESRLMNYVIVEVNGRDIIYVNVHFQHRSQNTATEEQTKIRYYERCAQFEMVQNQIADLKTRYTDACVIITGDFNDYAGSDFYNAVVSSYTDSKTVAITDNAVSDTWNSAFDVDTQGQGGTRTDTDTGSNDRIDFCFVSNELKNCVVEYQTGDYKWTISETDTVVYPSDHLPIIIYLEVK
ncbi:MAG: endonuclease/exonuclease/phosphatase family protein [Clostridia bacterium]|nr:endonuclease/exonuclease/phosphatase family protein [Clostridia bacterium]